MFTISEPACLCPEGQQHGVVPVRLTATEDIEVWAACHGEEEATAYEFGCNHTLVAKGETVTLPRRPVGNYDGAPHLHVRARPRAPHSNGPAGDWQDVTLTPCACEAAPAAR